MDMLGNFNTKITYVFFILKIDSIKNSAMALLIAFGSF